MVVMDFTTTAMARPDIVNKTYKSFSSGLKGIDLKECRLFINIDPLPENIDRREVTKTAKKYFKEVHPNYPEKANFTAACNWLWSNAETEFIFHLEDDWLLLQDVSVPELLKYFDQRRKLMEVALRAYKYEYKICPLSPCIMHERYYKAIAGNLNESVNPEIQLRGRIWGIEIPSPEFKVSHKGKLIIYPEKTNEVILKDSGRGWIKKSKFKKPSKKSKFTSWEKKK